MKRLFCLIALVSLLAGCGEPRRDQLKEMGLLDQHDLRRIEQVNGSNGHLNGSFFLGIGSVSGDFISERKLQFYWGRTAEEFISTTLPYNMFRFIMDNSKEIPTVEFIFDEDWLNESKYRYSESEKANLNFWFDEAVRARIPSSRTVMFRVAVIRISRKDLEKDIYLPKP